VFLSLLFFANLTLFYCQMYQKSMLFFCKWSIVNPLDPQKVSQTYPRNFQKRRFAKIALLTFCQPIDYQAIKQTSF